MSTNDGGPAFPFGQMSEQTGQPINGCFSSGMSTRDVIALVAMHAHISACEREFSDGTRNISREVAAREAYMQADAMLKAKEMKQ